jgi:hypothetical protein
VAPALRKIAKENVAERIEFFMGPRIESQPLLVDSKERGSGY